MTRLDYLGDLRRSSYFKPTADKWMTKVQVAALLWGAKEVEVTTTFPAFNCFALMYLLGLRVGEARLLRYEHLPPKFIDANGAPRAVEVPTLKKDPQPRWRSVRKRPPTTLWVPVLAHWSWVRDAFDPRQRPAEKAGSGWLFPSPQSMSKPITSRAIMYAWNRARAAGGLPDCYTSHSLRHGAGKAILATHPDRATVARFLRHTTDPFGSASLAYKDARVWAWEPLIMSRCMVLPELRPMPSGAP